MSNYQHSEIAARNCTLVLSGVRAIFLEVLLVAATVVLPVIAHLVGAPVRVLLPMHWPVILAGLVYGWRGGALTGLFAPIASYLISGLPLPIILPSMTAELFMYGLVTGLFREKAGFNSFLSTAVALALGRGVFIVSVLLGNVVSTSRLEYFKAALLPGLIAAAGQIILLPFLAHWWVSHEQRKK